MTVQEYLNKNKHINLTELARLMYPNNKNGAKQALYAKLKGDRKWSESDTIAAKRELKIIYKDGLDQINQLD